MSIIIDLIGAAIISSMLILMMITFQFSLYAAQDRMLYTMSMTDHMEMTATFLNNTIALAGVGVDPDDTVLHASADSLVFKTYWDFETETYDSTVNTISIKLDNAPTPYGTQILVAQNNVTLDYLGNIFWVKELKFRYYDLDDNLVNHPGYHKDDIRSAELRMAFFKAPERNKTPVETKLQFKCYFMNAYMQEGNPSLYEG
ncbi:MAG: hypothetical protein RBR69_10420 [Candidatus Cloacimonadaceae bacterium]|jgi:hypothetical protein|nr:hypothetical protein [Candidatus Cloacimonadaceae bacterium]